MQIGPISNKKVENLHHCRKSMQIRCQKGAGTKMHKCLVGRVLLFTEIRKDYGIYLLDLYLYLYYYELIMVLL